MLTYFGGRQHQTTQLLPPPTTQLLPPPTSHEAKSWSRRLPPIAVLARFSLHPPALRYNSNRLCKTTYSLYQYVDLYFEITVLLLVFLPATTRSL